MLRYIFFFVDFIKSSYGTNSRRERKRNEEKKIGREKNKIEEEEKNRGEEE